MLQVYRRGSVKISSKRIGKVKLRSSVNTTGQMTQDWKLAIRRSHIFYGSWNANHHLRTDFFVHSGIKSAVQRVEFISDRMMYI
jgi:hypothetical protein